MAQTYTIAIGADMLLGTVVDGGDIKAAIAEQSDASAQDIEFTTVSGLILTDDEPTNSDAIVWHSGNSGWLFDGEGNDRRFAVHA